MKKNEEKKTAARRTVSLPGVRVTAQEYKIIEQLMKAQDLGWADFVRKTILAGNEQKLIGAKYLVKVLDSAGEHLGQSAAAIRQLATKVATDTRNEFTGQQVAEQFNLVMQQYVRAQKSLEDAIRQIVRIGINSARSL